MVQRAISIVSLSGQRMTIKDAGDWIIWTGAIAGALYAIWLALRGAVVNPIRKSIGAGLVPVTERLKKVEEGQAALNQRMSDHIATHSRDLSRGRPPFAWSAGYFA